MGERLQEQKDYVNAAKIYQDVNGGEYGFAAKFNAAECEYVALVAASSKDNKDKSAAAANPTDLRNTAITLLRATIKDAPEAERSAPTQTQKKYVHDTTGRAKYMLAGLIQSPNNQTKPDAQDIASLLDNYEEQYPNMKEKSQDVFEWRLQALNTLGRYDDIQRDLSAFLERNKGNSANSDLIKTLGIDFWKKAVELQADGRSEGLSAERQADRDRILLLRRYGRVRENAAQESDRYALDPRPGLHGHRAGAQGRNDFPGSREGRSRLARC